MKCFHCLNPKLILETNAFIISFSQMNGSNYDFFFLLCDCVVGSSEAIRLFLVD